MRTFALILNIALIAFVVGLLIEEGFPDGNHLYAYLLLVAAPVANIASLLHGHSRKRESDNLLFLYIKRKALEEKMKISVLQTGVDSASKEACSTSNSPATSGDAKTNEHLEGNTTRSIAIEQNKLTKGEWFKSPYLLFVLPIVFLAVMFRPEHAYETLISTLVQIIGLALVFGIYYGVKWLAGKDQSK